MVVVRREYPTVTGIVITVINVIFGIIEVVIGLRIILELLGANTGAGFVQFIYGLSAPFVAPFIGIFPSRIFSGDFFLDAAAIVAFIVYGIIWMLLIGIIGRFSWGESIEK